MNLQPTMNVNYFAFLFIVMMLKTKDMIGLGCSIEPSNKVVVVGEVVSLTCRADGESSVQSWRLGSNGNKGAVVYQSAVYRSNGTLRAPEFTEKGYHVIKLKESEIVLQMNKTSLSQGGVYHCDCLYPSSTGSANLAVLAPEPEFVLNSNVVEGESVNFICSVSFSGTANASFEISIRNSSGSILKRRSSLPLSTNHNRYKLTHSAIADSNVDQTFNCSVTLLDHTSSTDVSYSKEKTATVQWTPVSSASIISPRSCRDGSCQSGETIQCGAEGNPQPKFKWLMFSYNGSQSEIVKTDGENLTLRDTGSFVFQCLTFNVIKNVRYNATSDNFTLEVTENAGTSASHASTSGAVIGVVIVVIVIVCVIIVFLAFLIHKKKISLWRVNDTGTIVERGKTPPEKTYDPRYTNSGPSNGTRNDEIALDNKVNKVQPPPPPPKKPTSASTVVPKPQPDSNSLGRDTIVQDNELYGDRLSTAIERQPDPPPVPTVSTISTVSTDGNDAPEALYSVII